MPSFSNSELTQILPIMQRGQTTLRRLTNKDDRSRLRKVLLIISCHHANLIALSMLQLAKHSRGARQPAELLIQVCTRSSVCSWYALDVLNIYRHRNKPLSCNSDQRKAKIDEQLQAMAHMRLEQVAGGKVPYNAMAGGSVGPGGSGKTQIFTPIDLSWASPLTRCETALLELQDGA
jgi:hypothetical protein